MDWIILGVFIVNLYFTVFGFFKIPKTYFLKSYFMFFLYMSCLWLFINFLTVHLVSTHLAKISYGIGAFVLSSFIVLTIAFSEQERISYKKILPVHIIAFIIFVLSVIPNIFFSVVITASKLEFHYTSLFGFYVLYISCAVLFILYKFFMCSKKFQGIKKLQANYMLLGGFGFASFSLLVSFLLPFLGWKDFAELDTCSSLFFVSLAMYAITKHKLMDIDLVWRYSLSYILYFIVTLPLFVASLHFVHDYLILRFLVVFVCLVISIYLYKLFVTDIRKRMISVGKNRYLAAMDELIYDDDFFLTTRDITNELLGRVKTIMNLDGVFLYLLKPDLKHFSLHVRLKSDDSSSIEDTLEIVDPILKIINPNMSFMFKEELERKQVSSKKIEILDFINRMNVSGLAPVFVDNVLQGILLLGRKKDNTIFNAEDVKRLNSIVKILRINISIRLMHQEGVVKSRNIYQGHLLDMSKKMIEIGDVDKLLSFLIRSLLRSVDAMSGTIYLYDPDKKIYMKKVAMGGDEHNAVTLINRDEYLIEYLRQREEPVLYKDLEGWARGLKSKDIDQAVKLAGDLQATVLLPMVSNILIGFIILGDKRTGSYTETDWNTFNIISHYATLSIQKLLFSEEASIDGLTGLYNRKMLDLKLEEVINNVINTRKTAEDRFFVFLMLDLDHFKKINDDYGHDVGDKVLKAVSNCIMLTIRPMDMCFRYGGEEIAVIGMQADKEGGRILGERIREAIIDDEDIAEIKHKHKIDREITMSVGVAKFEAPKEDQLIYNLKGLRENLVVRADQALYEAKKTGRNKVCLSED